MNRRGLLKLIPFLLFPWQLFAKVRKKMIQSSPILQQTPIDFRWPTLDPFLFCVHHRDLYPKGNSHLGVDESHFKGRNKGQDFELKDGFRMYHGESVPGFPVHPHRGFETITIVRRGYIDHADSLGASGRYGEGDVQWMTAGRGVQHSEMFPLLDTSSENLVELFQIWINLPSKNKMVPPDFKMLWSEKIPTIEKDGISVKLINGLYQGQKYFQAPANSWAADPENHVNILLATLNGEGQFDLPASKKKTNRMLYLFGGDQFEINGKKVSGHQALQLDWSVPLQVKAAAKGELLLLEALAINEPVVQHGPFVMNNRAQILQTISDYQETRFGGWKWSRPDMVHGPRPERFAHYPNGKKERP